VNVAVGPLTEECPGDCNSDSGVTVDEILAAVANALNGCGA
jgi:hypothetical protein